MKNFSIIVAMDNNQGIGKDGKLPWHLPSDLRYFKEVTISAPTNKVNAVIMGRKTWESIPEEYRPLPGRANVILTRNPDHQFPDGCIKAGSLEDAFSAVEQRQDIDQVFVIGGANIYEQAVQMKECRTIYVTKIAEKFDCDVLFPAVFQSFTQTYQSEEHVENDCHFYFYEFQRIN